MMLRGNPLLSSLEFREYIYIYHYETLVCSQVTLGTPLNNKKPIIKSRIRLNNARVFQCVLL